MKDKITLKDEKWVWPIIDENSWKGQNELKDLSNHILPYIKNKYGKSDCYYIISIKRPFVTTRSNIKFPEARSKNLVFTYYKGSEVLSRVYKIDKRNTK